MWTRTAARLLIAVAIAGSLLSCGGEPRAGEPVMVADPRPGDLRSDAEADVLPVGYEASAAPVAMLDIAYGTNTAQKLDLYLPTDPGAAVVMFLHSGGWVAGDKQAVPEMVRRFLELGYAVASVDYRLAPQHPFPAPVQDVKRAIRWLKAYGVREGLVDGDRMVVYGTSAGGHLAAFVAATPGEFEPEDLTPEEASFDSTVAGIVSVGGPTDLVSLYASPQPWAQGFTGATVGCDPCTDDSLWTASPLGHLHPDLPPAFWVYGEDDDLVEPTSQGVAIANAWAEQAGADSSWLDLVDDRGHNIDHSSINQRQVEEFVELATSSEPEE